MENVYSKFDKNVKYHYLFLFHYLFFLVYVAKCSAQLEYPTMQSSGIKFSISNELENIRTTILIIFFTHSFLSRHLP